MSLACILVFFVTKKVLSLEIDRLKSDIFSFTGKMLEIQIIVFQRHFIKDELHEKADISHIFIW